MTDRQENRQIEKIEDAIFELDRLGMKKDEIKSMLSKIIENNL